MREVEGLEGRCFECLCGGALDGLLAGAHLMILHYGHDWHTPQGGLFTTKRGLLDGSQKTLFRVVRVDLLEDKKVFQEKEDEALGGRPKDPRKVRKRATPSTPQPQPSVG